MSLMVRTIAYGHAYLIDGGRHLVFVGVGYRVDYALILTFAGSSRSSGSEPEHSGGRERLHYCVLFDTRRLLVER
jgi:hypothetical protein